MKSKAEIESLIYLLEDPDPFVNKTVVNRLLKLGEQAVPLLDEYRIQSQDERQENAIINVIHNITFSELEEEFMNYVDNGINTVSDLEKGVFMIARFGDSTFRELPYRERLDKMADDIATDIKFTVDPVEQMRLLIQYVFYDENFHGVENDYFDPNNSYINRVIDRKTGIPITLALIVLFLADRLDLPFHGVNMPMHFLLKFQNETEQIFVDPFHRGKVVSMNQCSYFLKMNGVKPESYYFQNAPMPDILARSIRNLIYSYEKRDDTMRAEDLRKLLHYIDLTYGDSDDASDMDESFE
jgi:regulator of sirC expression with transglutaminase-like and TPR domain